MQYITFFEFIKFWPEVFVKLNISKLIGNDDTVNVIVNI